MGLINRILQNGTGQEDAEVAYEKGLAEGQEEARKVTRSECYAAAVEVLKRDYGFDKDKLTDFLTNMDLFAASMANHPEQVKEALDAAGVMIVNGQGWEHVWQRTQRTVLCERCLYGDPVSSRTWDCDMLDGITSGKTECKHYKER